MVENQDQNKKQKGKKNEFAFIRAFEQLKDVPSSNLRPPKPAGTDPFVGFEVVFRGENVVGFAGPFRQFYADISKELLGSI